MQFTHYLKILGQHRHPDAFTRLKIWTAKVTVGNLPNKYFGHYFLSCLCNALIFNKKFVAFLKSCGFLGEFSAFRGG
ncbi:MAG: hypothetical protein EAY75_05550 [Bacteroidetes bacterium]|nr:MAG: hypothetical protein EAY75_05550 [Bacteroidota bacterium]